MGSDFRTFEDVIGKLQRSSRLHGTTSLILAGRIERAVERGDITPRQADELLDRIEPGFKARYAEALELAAVGDLDMDAVLEPVAGVYG